MLLANRFTVNLARSNPLASIPINAGTGKFAMLTAPSTPRWSGAETASI